MRFAKLFLPITLALVACDRSPAAPAPASPADGPAPSAESQPTNETPDARIIALVPSAAEVLFALGAGDDVIARSAYSSYPPEVLELPSIGSGLDPDVERIVGLRPTLVVAAEMQRTVPAVATIQAAGIEVFFMPDESVADIDAALRTLGERLGRGGDGVAAAEALQTSLAEARAPEPEGERPSVLLVVGSDPLFVAGDEAFTDDLIQAAGGRTAVPGTWVQLDDERVVATAPDVIVQTGTDPADLARWDSFGDVLPATRDGRVCLIEPDPIARPGPRVALAVRALRDCIER